MQVNDDIPSAGRLRYFYDQWSNITNDRLILSWIQGYKIPLLETPYQTLCPNNLGKSNEAEQIIDLCMSDMLETSVISPCLPCEGQFLSPIFTVPKPNGEHRFILNLKMLNRFVEVEHFKMEDYRSVLKMLDNNQYMATLDLKDAYFLIPIDESSKKLLRFKWKDKLFEFNVLPFGLCTAPYVFTKLLKPVVQQLRLLGLSSVVYLDDFLCIGNCYESCINNINNTTNILISLGFIINFKKSQLTPNTFCKFLGFNFDTTNMTITLPNDKKLRIKTMSKKLMNTQKCTIRAFAQYIGLLTSACPAVMYGWNYTKIFEREKFLALNYFNGNYNRSIILPPYLKSDFKWWINSIDQSLCPIRNDNFSLEIYTDASLTGWGAVCHEQTASGNWKDSELLLHINTLELKAAFYGLKIFANNLRNCNILLRVDNTTAICYINRMGGIQHTQLNQLSRNIWQWCETRNLFIFASYIKSSENINADYESRQLHVDTEWELADYAFKNLTKSFGYPNFDLFASAQNSKCERYSSWKLDPHSEIVDAFTFNWSKLKFYAFPPFCLVFKVLRKIVTDKATGVVVVPYWPSQPWFPLWLTLVISEQLIFEPNKNLLYSPFRECHPLHSDLTLVAARLSGNR